MISKYCRDRNIVGNSRNFAARVCEADEAITQDLCKKFFFSLGTYLDAYKGGANGKNVGKKVKELKRLRRRHRSAPALTSGEEKRGKYDRKRGRNAINHFHDEEFASASHSEDEDLEEYSLGERRSSASEEEGEEEEQGDGGDGELTGEQEAKGALWDLVTTFLLKSTGHGPSQNQRFLFTDFMQWMNKVPQETRPEENYLQRLFGHFQDIFSCDGDEICIISTINKEAVGAFRKSLDEEEKFESGRKAIWTVVKNFILETTGKKPFELQHFFLSDLQDWYAKKMEGQEVEWGLRNLVQHIDFYDDKYSRENDNCWIEEYDSKEDDSGEEEEEVY